MKILVTGHAGFIGSHLTEKLLSIGYSVVGIDNYNNFYDPEIKKSNTTSFKDHSDFIEYKLDLSSDNLDAVFQQNQVDLVIHLAASAGVRPSMESPVDYSKNNITAMVNLLDSMQRNQLKKIIFASSSSVYGGIETVPFKEEMILDKVMSTYAATKLSGETFNQLYHDSYGFSVINLRFFTVFGPRQRPDLAIHKFFRMMKEGKEITLYGEGELKRDYTYVDDIVNGVIGALNRIISSSKSFLETYNLGNNNPITVKELVETMEVVSGLNAKKTFAPIPVGDVPITFANIDKAKDILGYAPKTDLEKGLTFFWNWFKSTYREKNTAH